jgi:5-methylcytosine-specific restriction endonuclease McrA
MLTPSINPPPSKLSMNRHKWREKYLVNGREYRFIYIVRSCAIDIGISTKLKVSPVSQVIRERFPDIAGSNVDVVLKYANRMVLEGRSIERNSPSSHRPENYDWNKKPKPKEQKVEVFDFYKSRAWLQIRYLALRNNGAICQCCGASQKEGAILHVDHVKPRSKYPHLALELSNLQILCSECNIGKSDWDTTDWRPIVD